MRELSQRVRQMVEASRSVGAPSTEARERLSRALGRRLAVGAVVAAATLGSREVAGASASSASTIVASAGTVKWLLASLLVVAGGLGGFGAYRWSAQNGWPGGPGEALQAVSAARVTAAPSVPRLAPNALAQPEPVPANSAASRADPARMSRGSPSRTGRPLPSGARTAGDLGRELELLRGAQRALDSGAAAQALASLNQYSREFPRGSLRHEYSMVRVLALCAAGQRTSALRARKDFLEREPNSALAHRVKNACGAAEPSPTTSSNQE
jgi:hypothetical protein